MSVRAVLTIVCAFGVLVAAGACKREERRFRETSAGLPPAFVRVGALQPGKPVDTTHVRNPYESNAYAQTEGQRLFGWYNCSGCHANGGGGMGPALMDDKWIYGSEPEQIFASIAEGRPNGMPSFGGRIPTPQIWQLVTYVRSLAGLTPASGRSSRSDHMMMYPGSQALPQQATPKKSTRPPASEMP
jgi:cytochrome c oxidase cbb3-type subunit 3